MNGAPRIAPTPISSWAAPLAEEDGDERDQRLGHRGADGGEDAADGAFVEVQVKSKPFDGVGKQLCGDKDDGEADEEEKEG